MHVNNKLLVQIMWCSLLLLTQTAFSTGPAIIDESLEHSKPLDKRLYEPPTLKKFCLLALQPYYYIHEQLPQEVNQAAIAFDNVHERKFQAVDLQISFNFCASPGLQEKVSAIHERMSQEDRSYNLYFFENLFSILHDHCNNNINHSLIQLSRYDHCRKRKVHYAILLSLGANINYYGSILPRIRSTTPLITATIHKRTSCVEMLLKNKARVNKKASDGYNAYTLAKRWPDQTIANLLCSYGAIFIPVRKDFDDDLEHEISYDMALACTIQ